MDVLFSVSRLVVGLRKQETRHLSLLNLETDFSLRLHVIKGKATNPQVLATIKALLLPPHNSQHFMTKNAAPNLGT